MTNRKHPSLTYETFDNFVEQAIRVAKDKIDLYNKFAITKDGTQILQIIANILKYVGYKILGLICALLIFGFFGYAAGVGSLIAIHPILAAILAGGTIVVWNKREVVIKIHATAEKFRPDFEKLQTLDSTEKKVQEIDKLLDDLVKIICTDIYHLSQEHHQGKSE